MRASSLMVHSIISSFFFLLTPHSLLARWPAISPVQALELLDAQFSDSAVRKYAVRRLKTLEDHEVEDYLLQLTQVRIMSISLILYRKLIRCRY